jgi:hypothetical protein
MGNPYSMNRVMCRSQKFNTYINFYILLSALFGITWEFIVQYIFTVGETLGGITKLNTRVVLNTYIYIYISADYAIARSYSCDTAKCFSDSNCYLVSPSTYESLEIQNMYIYTTAL